MREQVRDPDNDRTYRRRAGWRNAKRALGAPGVAWVDLMTDLEKLGDVPASH